MEINEQNSFDGSGVDLNEIETNLNDQLEYQEKLQKQKKDAEQVDQQNEAIKNDPRNEDKWGLNAIL